MDKNCPELVFVIGRENAVETMQAAFRRLIFSRKYVGLYHLIVRGANPAEGLLDSEFSDYSSQPSTLVSVEDASPLIGCCLIDSEPIHRDAVQQGYMATDPRQNDWVVPREVVDVVPRRISSLREALLVPPSSHHPLSRGCLVRLREEPQS